MKLDLTFHTGKPLKPAVILIHGLGVNRYFWENPEKCNVFGGLFPLTVFLSKTPVANHRSVISGGVPDPALKGLFARLSEAGFSIASWSQRQPIGPISSASAELQEVFQRTKEKWPGRPLYLIGHSRGGLIAKKFLLEHRDDDVHGLITLGTPFKGTNMAGFAVYLRPIAGILEKMVPKDSQSKMAEAISRLTMYLKSAATQELLPQSELIESIKGPLPGRFKKISFGGTDPSLFKLYVKSLAGGEWNILPFPDLLLKAVPANRLPDELKSGLGDALVSARSSVLEGSVHYDIPTNHVGIAYDKGVQDMILEFLGT